MSNTKKEALKYFNTKPTVKEVHATSDGFLFEQKQNATAHSRTLEDQDIQTFTNSVGSEIREDSKDKSIQEKPKDEGKKPSPADLKTIKDKTIADYKELFSAEPDSKLPAAKIQELIDAKKVELANAVKPE